MAKDDDKIINAVLSSEEQGIELSAKEKAQIEAEVRAEVEKELKAEKRKEFRNAAKQKLKRQVLFQHGKDELGEDTEMVLITCAPNASYIRLDSNIYFAGRAYRVSRGKAAVLKEQMFRGEQHENEIRGKNATEFYRQRPVGLVLKPGMENVAH